MADFLTAEDLVRAYSSGIFPMAETQDDPELFWVDPLRRGVFPLDGFHISRSLRKRMLRGDYTVFPDRDFARCVRHCADRSETWINAPLHRLYGELFDKGVAHSIEVWQENQMVGGVFGLTIGGAFFGESMFSHQRDMSKIALAFLIDRLNFGAFTLFDTQFITPHLASLGATEISRADYLDQLDQALESTGNFDALPAEVHASEVLQRSTQTS